MCLSLNDYKFKTSRYIIVNIYKPHGNYKSKTYNRYTKIRKNHKHATKENYQTTKKETKKKTEKKYKNN